MRWLVCVVAVLTGACGGSSVEAPVASKEAAVFCKQVLSTHCARAADCEVPGAIGCADNPTLNCEHATGIIGSTTQKCLDDLAVQECKLWGASLPSTCLSQIELLKPSTECKNLISLVCDRVEECGGSQADCVKGWGGFDWCDKAVDVGPTLSKCKSEVPSFDCEKIVKDIPDSCTNVVLTKK